MAMTGMRRLMTGLGVVEETPPDEMARRGVPQIFEKIPPDKRDEVVELAHWLYGAAAGAAFGMLPRDLRRRLWAGPLYGLLIWAFFEAAVVPLFELRSVRKRARSERLALAADHVLYGTVVAARPRGV
jgi:uncharacterized membrane protein YagU involved in acid resistance